MNRVLYLWGMLLNMLLAIIFGMDLMNYLNISKDLPVFVNPHLNRVFISSFGFIVTMINTLYFITKAQNRDDK